MPANTISGFTIDSPQEPVNGPTTHWNEPPAVLIPPEGLRRVLEAVTRSHEQALNIHPPPPDELNDLAAL